MVCFVFDVPVTLYSHTNGQGTCLGRVAFVVWKDIGQRLMLPRCPQSCDQLLMTSSGSVSLYKEV